MDKAYALTETYYIEYNKATMFQNAVFQCVSWYLRIYAVLAIISLIGFFFELSWCAIPIVFCVVFFIPTIILGIMFYLGSAARALNSTLKVSTERMNLEAAQIRSQILKP